MLFSSTAFPTITLLATIAPFTIAHPLNLLHSHHRHHSHHHLHLRLPKFGSNAAKAAPALQHPLTNNSPAPTVDISNVFVNMTLTSAENPIPMSFLVPLHPSKPEPESSVEPTASTLHHPHTATISNIQYGTSTKATSQQFERPGDVVCYAHATATHNSNQKSERRKSRQERAKAFRQSDGEIDLVKAGENLAGVVSTF
ncbi:MAG: hypothetical protein Q9171_005921, partial [Xanthocarpia ochracea]